MGSSTPGFIVGFLSTALVAAGFAILIYNAAFPVALMVGVVFGGLMVFLMNNREKNLKKWEKHPTTFPNQLGGGIVGEYVKRPWMRELAELGEIYGRKKGKKQEARRRENE